MPEPHTSRMRDDLIGRPDVLLAVGQHGGRDIQPYDVRDARRPAGHLQRNHRRSGRHVEDARAIIKRNRGDEAVNELAVADTPQEIQLMVHGRFVLRGELCEGIQKQLRVCCRWGLPVSGLASDPGGGRKSAQVAEISGRRRG